MKIPENPPELGKLSEPEIKRLLTPDPISVSELSALVKKANEEYLYWDTFKYLEIPAAISKELAWAYLKLTRNSQIRKTPLKDIKNSPFGYWLPDSVLKILHEIDQNAGGQILVDDPRVRLSENERYLVSSIMEEAIASSQLEGAATTRKKAKEMLKLGKKPTTTAEQMILNNYLTIKSIKKYIDKPLSKELIIEIQASITKDTLEDKTAVGRFKKEGEENEVVDRADGTVLFQPPPVSEIEERIKTLCAYANEERSETFVHPVVKAILLHFGLAYIHPFVDGNGRTSRALFYWYMLKNKYWLFEYLSISRILIRAPGQYKRAYLYSEIDGQDLTYFLMFNLRAVNLAIRGLHAYLTKQQQELRETTLLIKKYPGLNHRQYDLLFHAVSDPAVIYTIKFQKNVHNVSYETARADLLELERNGFLTRIQRKGKEFAFVPSKDINKKLKGLVK